jgi:uncharacterized protein
MKYLIVLVVVVALLWWLLARPRKVSGRAGKSATPTITFVACAHCGVHLPGSDALMDGEKAYCSEAHRRAGPSDPNTR